MLQSLKSQIDSSVASMRRLLQRPPQRAHRNARPDTPEAARRRQQREAQHQRVRRMRRELYMLLGQHPSSRKLMRHLAMVERTLQEAGLQGFEALPTGVITTALAELERLVWDWSPAGLAELRSRMAVLVKNPPSAAAAEQRIDVRTAVGLGHVATAEVSEVDHAEFEEMERSWTGVVPKPAAHRATA